MIVNNNPEQNSLQCTILQALISYALHVKPGDLHILHSWLKGGNMILKGKKAIATSLLLFFLVFWFEKTTT